MKRIIIIGSGVTGLSIARWLSKYNYINITVIERNPDVGWGVSKANTSIIHPCHEEDPSSHPVRARLCVEGHRLWYRWVEELDIPSRWPGELIVAFNMDQLRGLRKYVVFASELGVPGVRLIDHDELLALEPTVNTEAVGGLYAPTAGTIGPMPATVALAENAAANGVRFLFETRVEKIVTRDHRVMGVETDKGFIEADIVINAAGLYADKLARTVGVEDYSIHPRRGEYVLFSERVKVKPYRIVHTAPTEKTKGVYAITTVGGTLMIGPNAEDLGPEDREKTWTTHRGVDYVLEQGRRLLGRLPPRDKIIRLFAGLRPEPSTGDFIIRFHEDPWGYVEAAGIRSPGLTAAPAIGKHVAELVAKHLGLKPKERWVSRRRGIRKIRTAGPGERQRLIRENPLYGHIICQCEMISEAEIIEAIERMKMIGIRNITLDGIKFRTHAMCGDCQGGFCRHRIALIISKHTGIPPWKVSLKGGGTEIGVGGIGRAWRG